MKNFTRPSSIVSVLSVLLAGCTTPTTSGPGDDDPTPVSPSEPSNPTTNPDPAPQACGIATPGQDASWSITDLDEAGSPLVAATDTATFLYGSRGVRVSTDGGDTFSRLETLPAGFFLRALAGSGGALFALGYQSEIGPRTYQSQDDGSTWTIVEALEGVSAQSLRASGDAVLADNYLWTAESGAFVALPNDNFVFVLASDGETSLGSPYGASFRTVDGQTWEEIADLANVLVSRFAIEGQLAVAVTDQSEVYRSLDAGATWAPVAFDKDQLGGIGDLMIHESQILFMTTKGVVRSSDALATAALEVEIPASFGSLFFEQARLAAGGGRVYLAGADLYRSADLGDSWSKAPKLIDATPFALASSGSYVLASTMDMKLHASEDAASYTEIPSSGFAMTDFATDGASHFLLMRSTPPGTIGYFADGSLLRLDDGATSFEPVTPPQQTYVVSFGEIHTHDGVLLLGAESSLLGGNAPSVIDGPGVYRSTDKGATWSLANEGLEPTGKNPSTYKNTYPAFVELASFGDEIFGGLADGKVVRSRDGGQSWERADAGLDDLGAAPVDSFTDAGGTLLASSRLLSRTLLRWDEGAGAWTVETPASLPEAPVAKLVSHGGYVFAALTRGEDASGGVFFSADAGETWTDAGLGHGAVSLVVHHDGLLAGTDGDGLFQLALGPCE